MPNEFSVTIVVPTRNRPELARNAIWSVVEQRPQNTRIVVSDNSTSAEAVAEVAEFCANFKQRGVEYIRPPEPLSMTQHYDWAFTHALANPATTHIALLTDRMIFRNGALADVLNVARGTRDTILTYNHDRIVDHVRPVRLEQNPWSGDLFEMSSSGLLELASRGVFHSCLPRMMNCIVPRGVFQAIRARHGNLFESIAPDFNFCFRALDLCDSIVYYDAFPLIHYALDRSNGESQARGVASKDHLDFIANLGGRSFNFSAPVPEFLTVGNAIVHEYCYVRERSRSGKLPPVDRRSYFNMINAELPGLQNDALREKMKALLTQQLQREPGGAALASELHRSREGAPLWRRSLRPVRRLIIRGVQEIPWRNYLPGVGSAVETAVTLPTVLKFASTKEALNYASAHKRQRQTGTKHLRVLGSALGQKRVVRETVA